MLGKAINSLGERDRHILFMRFFKRCTQTEIADDLGVTQMQVSRLLTQIFRHLRATIGEVDDLRGRPGLSERRCKWLDTPTGWLARRSH